MKAVELKGLAILCARTLWSTGKMFDYGRLAAMQQKGLCCSQIIMQLGIEEAGLEENPDLITAMTGLCAGLHTGLICGILTGAACLLALCRPESTAAMVKELADWFKDEYAAADKGINCEDILAGDFTSRAAKCPGMLAAAYEKAIEILEEHGYEFGAVR